MRIAGWIFTIIGGISFLGSLIGGTGSFGPLSFLAIGIVLLYFANEKEEEKRTSENNIKAMPSKETSTVTRNEQEVPKKEEVKTNCGSKQSIEKKYWERFKTENSEKASQISDLLCIDLSTLSDKDAMEKVNTIDRLCNQYKCSISQVKARCLNDLNEFPLSFLDKMIGMIEAEMENESIHYNIAKDNTTSALLSQWLKERKLFLENNNIYNEQSKNEHNEFKQPSEEYFRKKYSNILAEKIGNNANVSLFCEGYDSPIAQELMDIMYAFIQDENEKDLANKGGYGNRYIFIIIEETEKIVKKYCHVALQECIDYYNFPNRKVKTSFRCPYCGSWQFEREEFYNECMECGRTWTAPLGYNLYLETLN